jgi:hypothetical protein
MKQSIDNNPENISEWPVPEGEDQALVSLAVSLEQEFAVERAILSSGVVDRVVEKLPVKATPLLRFARILTGMILISSAGCVALVAVLACKAGANSTGDVLRMVVGLSMVTMAILLAFAAPKFVLWDSQLIRKLTGKLSFSEAGELVLIRLGALIISIAGGLVLLP